MVHHLDMLSNLLRSLFFVLMYSSSVVYLARVHKLLAAANGNLLGIGLVHEGLVGSLDGIEGALRSRYAGSNVVDAGGTAHFKQTVRYAEAES